MIEYSGTNAAICAAAATYQFDGQKKTLPLDNAGTHCP